eukprot:scaffold91746_cov59-Phaeocystis_antarctica.AAC.1
MPFAALSPATRSPALASAAQITLRLHRAVRPGGSQAASCRMQSAPGSVSSDPLEADSLRCAWSCPLSNEIFQVEPQGPEEEVAGLGVAIALGKLLSEWSDPGWLPDLFNERVARLTGVGAATPSFPFVEMHSSLEQQPPQGVIHQFVMVLVSCLHMSVAEVVMAYALVSSPAPPAYPMPARCLPRSYPVPTWPGS